MYKDEIQNINVSKDLGREEINELGRVSPYKRFVEFPIDEKGIKALEEALNKPGFIDIIWGPAIEPGPVLKQPMTQKVAIITGVNGQDGSYLSELLLEKGYRVVGIHRRSSVNTSERLANIIHNKDFVLVEGDVSDYSSISNIIRKYTPDEFYNLAAQSHVATSFTQPQATIHVNAGGVLNILEAIRLEYPRTRFYQASTSEMFGANYDTKDEVNYQNECTHFAPRSPYAVAKLAAHNMVFTYRESYGLHASCGILFNHESPRRGEQFVTRKITKWIAEFKKWRHQEFYTIGRIDALNPDTIHLGKPVNGGLEEFPKLRLGNLDAYRDWGHARDYVEAMWLMLQQDKPDDYVVATGETHTIREFLDIAFKEAGLGNWEPFVVIDPQFFRPAEVAYLCGDSTKIRTKLHWEPKVSFEELVKDMVHNEKA